MFFGRKSLCHKISFSLTEEVLIKGIPVRKSTLISTILGFLVSIFIMDKVDVKNIRKYAKFFYAGTDFHNGSIMENLIFGINNPNPAKVKFD